MTTAMDFFRGSDVDYYSYYAGWISYWQAKQLL